MRLTKTVDGVTHTYSLDGDRIVAEEWGNQLLVYFYDDAGLPMGMMYRNSSYADKQFDYYLYEKDVFGNIIAIYNASGTKVASYCYDAWGNCTVLTNVNGIGTLNPFRYRGYYLDTETNLYYLQTRYYDSYTGRFINADGQLNGGLLGYNLFAYCENNPVMYTDPTGEFAGVLTFGTLLIGAILVVALVVVGVELTRQLCRAIETSHINTAEIEKEEVEIQTNENGDVIFPVNPDDFHPMGLLKVPRPGTKNGVLISWMDPVTGIEVFRWDENLNYSNGPHYHIYGTDHYAPGRIVPEPYSSIYFPLH